MIISSDNHPGAAIDGGKVFSVSARSPRVLMVNSNDAGGGAEKVARELVLAYRSMGKSAYFAVGYRQQDVDWVLAMPDHKRLWARGWCFLASRLRRAGKGYRTIQGIADFARDCVAQPVRWVRKQLGHEEFSYPGTKHLLSLPPERPDLLHVHNMHGSYFDLRALSSLSRRIPTMLTLHDAWLLSGHCAHSFDCERWRTGCGSCPDLTIPPRVTRDATAFNWKRKRDIFENSRVYLATPCEWLLSKVKDSILAPAIVEARVIPYGIADSAFSSVSTAAARAELGIPAHAKVILFVANGIQRNPWKDYTTLRKAIELLSSRMQSTDLMFIGLGENAPAERVGRAELKFLPYQRDPARVRMYYHAADIYAHAARADTFPNVVLEALACGTPVVATAIGGIPEQVKALQPEGEGIGHYRREEATGLLVPPARPEAMASAFERLLTHDALRAQLAENAPYDMRSRFSMERQVKAYMSWYYQILGLSTPTLQP